MTVCSGRLDFTLSVHLMSDGSGSHCQVMSEGPRQFNMCTPTVSNCGCAVPTRFHMHLNTFSPSEAENILQNSVIILYSGKCSLSAVIRSLRLCRSACALPLTPDVHHTGMCVNSCFIFSISEGSHSAGIILAPASAGILSSSIVSSTIGCTTASPTAHA